MKAYGFPATVPAISASPREQFLLLRPDTRAVPDRARHVKTRVFDYPGAISQHRSSLIPPDIKTDYVDVE